MTDFLFGLLVGVGVIAAIGVAAYIYIVCNWGGIQ